MIRLQIHEALFCASFQVCRDSSALWCCAVPQPVSPASGPERTRVQLPGRQDILPSALRVVRLVSISESGVRGLTSGPAIRKGAAAPSTERSNRVAVDDAVSGLRWRARTYPAPERISILSRVRYRMRGVRRLVGEGYCGFGRVSACCAVRRRCESGWRIF